jgi:DNA-binding transcriptional LysR family regulator
MLVHARATLASLERVQSKLGDFQQGVRGAVRIAANGSAMSQTLPAEVGRFLTAHPGIHLHLIEMGSGDTVRALRTGQIDIGIFESTSAHIGIETRSYRSDRVT